MIALFDAKTKLSEICSAVNRNHEALLITRRGIPIVKIEPLDEESQAESVWAARQAFIAKNGDLDEELVLAPRKIEIS